MARLYAALIRHGDYHQRAATPSAHQPFPLTDRGRQQARRAAPQVVEFLARQACQLAPAVDSSRLLRAWQTARIIADVLLPSAGQGIQIQEFDALAERGLGSAANLSVETIEQVIEQDPRYGTLPADWKSNSHFKLPLQGAESLLEAGARVAAHLAEQMHQLAQTSHTDTLKLFIGHGAAFRHAAYHLGVLRFEQIAQLSMYHASPVYLQYQADKGWRHCRGDWKIRNPESDPND